MIQEKTMKNEYSHNCKYVSYLTLLLNHKAKENQPGAGNQAIAGYTARYVHAIQLVTNG